MKLALSIIFLFSLLSSCEASVSAANTHAQWVQGSAEFPQYFPYITQDHDHSGLFYSDTAADDFSAEDIEEEDERDNFSFRKCKHQSRGTSASEQVITLSRIHNDYLLPAPTSFGPPTRKYIIQGTLRI